jgi:LysM repeat protein
MNNPNQPNQPNQQVSVLERKNQGRARVRLAVFVVLSIHVVGLMALLMQGCKREEPLSQPAPTNAPPVFEATNVPVAQTNLPVVTPPVAPPVVETPAVPPAATGVTEYTIAKGDTFYSVGKKLGVSFKAIEAANPGVDPAKLQPGQKIKIPAAAPAMGVSTGQEGAATAPATGETVYVVKSGDTLTKIATHYGVTVKALRSANNLATDRIKVGQKLKIPIKATTLVTPAEPAPTAPAAAPAPAAPPQQ